MSQAAPVKQHQYTTPDSPVSHPDVPGYLIEEFSHDHLELVECRDPQPRRQGEKSGHQKRSGLGVALDALKQQNRILTDDIGELDSHLIAEKEVSVYPKDIKQGESIDYTRMMVQEYWERRQCEEDAGRVVRGIPDENETNINPEYRAFMLVVVSVQIFQLLALIVLRCVLDCLSSRLDRYLTSDLTGQPISGYIAHVARPHHI
ncbi:hypothetical protein ANO14919_109420 [Xylariales sp. No.14919]|nr:hypothetical protein ANO14919_109420 [Xylariales sp. No.14919]